MNSIIIFASMGIYYARFTDPMIKTLMGTDTIKTPYSTSYNAGKMIQEIKEKNPDCNIIFYPA